MLLLLCFTSIVLQRLLRMLGPCRVYFLPKLYGANDGKAGIFIGTFCIYRGNACSAREPAVFVRSVLTRRIVLSDGNVNATSNTRETIKSQKLL